MLLNQLFSPKPTLLEGGNVSSQSPGWQGTPGDHKAEEIDLKLHDRDFMVDQIRNLLKSQNESFAQAYGRPIWDPELLDSNQMFSGSSLHFFDVKGISTQDFLNKLKKTKVGDIDTQVDQEIGDEITAWLKSIIGRKVGNGTFIGFNSSLSAIWRLDDPPVNVQIDYELGPYQPAQGKEPARPTEWFAYSHSSDYDDLVLGIKGVFHKYINRALTHASVTTKYAARVLKKSVKISPEPVTDSDYSFAVSSAQGGGMSVKYKPYIDPQTGQPMEIDGIPVMQLLEPSQRDYIQSLDKQFEITYGRKRTAKDKKLQNSFVGTIQLMNGNFDPQQNESVARAFLQILFGRGAQMITANDPIRDRDTKFSAVDYMVENLKLPNAQGLRQEAVQMAMDYEAQFSAKQAAKTPTVENFADGRNPQDKGDSKRYNVPTKGSVSSLRKIAKQGGRRGQLAHWMANMKSGRKKANESLTEAEVQAQLRKNMPHLKDLKPIDFLDLVDELHQGNGKFALENIPLNVKVDGFGGRFGKDADGKPFMGTSNTPPRYSANFVQYHQQKGTTDPEILGRAEKFDSLFNEMMQAVGIIDEQLGPDALLDKQITCEVLFLPFATETPEGKLKFVGIHYDKLPDGVQLALVPYRVTSASTGDDLPESDDLVKAITSIGQAGSVMFISNRLVQKQGLDVTEIINVLDNIDELKAIVSDTQGKRDKESLALRREVEAKLQPVKERLEQAIINDPNIIGKEMLGQDYEGIVINSRLGPIKITSQKQRDVITAKNAAKAAARAEQPRENQNKTAVVAIGSFVGHIGHEQLWDYTKKKAAELGGDPYLFIGNAQGKDDPIPPAVKVQTWHKMYPEDAKNISTVTQEGGSLLQKIKHELINPLPGKPPRYDNIVIMVGEDQAGLTMPQALMKAVNKFQGYEHVKVSLEPTPRGTGMSFTKLRNILKDPNATPEQQYAEWAKGFDEAKLGQDWILKLMDITRQGMGIKQMPQQQLQPLPVPERLLNALIMPQLNEARQSASVKLQKAFQREQEKSAASRRRGEEVMAQAKKDAEKKSKEQGVAEYGDTARGQKMLTKVQKRAVDRMIKADDKRDAKAAKKNQDTANRAWDRMTDKDVAEGTQTVGHEILGMLRQIKRQGHDAMEELYSSCPLLAQFWDQYEGDFRSMVIELSPKTLNRIKAEISAFNQQGVAEGLNEFAPPGSNDGGDDGFSEETLKRLAAQWYNGDEDPRVERTLMAAGWEIGQDEGYDDEPGVFVVRSGDINGSSYISWPAHELKQGVAEGLNEFAPAGGGGNIPRGPKTPRRGPWDDGGEDPYQLRRYNRSADFFDQFDSDGVDKQNFDKATGEYEGYYFDRDAASGITQIAYFKFDDPTKIGDNDPGVGWYYEPVDEGVAEGQLDEIVNPTSIIAGAIRWAINNPSIVAALGVAGAGAAVAATGGAAALGPILTAATGVTAGEVGMGILTLDKLKELIQTNPDQAEGWVKQQIYKYIGDDEDAKEFELLHAKTAYLGKDRIFRWRAKEWNVTMKRDDAEAFLEKADKYWLETEKNKEAEKEKAQQVPQVDPVPQPVAESSSGAKYKVKSIGKDKKGDYYVSPNTGKKVYKQAKVGDHETPNGEIKPKVETMLPKSAFAGSNKNKLGPAAHLKGKMKRPAQQGDLVGGTAESIEEKIKGADGKACWKGKRYAGTKNGRDVCVPVREDVEHIIRSLVEQLGRK